MNEGEKQLLAKALCGYLPYGLKICKENVPSLLKEEGRHIEEVQGIDLALTILLTNTFARIEYMKPYLRPMSSMTENEFYELIELGVSLPSSFKEYYGQMQYYSSGGEWSVIDVEIEDIIKYMNYLNAHHFDYYGLIGKGLALEAPEGMYNTK